MAKMDMRTHHHDYSLYLVTDSTPAILGDRDIAAVVRAAVEGGVTMVQYRDKKSDTSELVRIGTKLHDLTLQHGIPLIINDRVDVALAVGAEGVHVGQDDMSLEAARRIMGKEAIIGVTASSTDEALSAAKYGANYIGIGTVYSTNTKQDAKSIIGPGGVQEILAALFSHNHDVPTVCIGGISAANAQRVIYQSASAGKSLNGVAVVSAIMGAKDPQQAAAELLQLVRSRDDSKWQQKISLVSEPAQLIATVPAVLRRVAEIQPLNHNMTNLVVQNFAANVALACGSSPIMSNNGLEAADLAALGGSLVVNMGTIIPDSLRNYIQALRCYNMAKGPALFDPVGGGATEVRRNAVKHLMAEGYFDVIKGNESEIQTVLGELRVAQHGVDSSSGGSKLSGVDKAQLVKRLAQRERNVILMTGQIDYLSDGIRTYSISNGHEYLGTITGSGCALGAVIAAALAVERRDPLVATLAGVLLYEIAAERTAVKEEVKGPGTFTQRFIDELFTMRTNLADCAWLDAARVDALQC